MPLTFFPVASDLAIPEPSIASALSQVTLDLEDINLRTEQTFLAVGGKLMEFVAAADRIFHGVQQLAEAIAGTSGRRASQALRAALENCRAMQARATERDRLLADLRAGAQVVRSAFAGIEDSTATFRVLCTLTRLETARLGDAGSEFVSLSEDVRSLSQNMEAKVDNVLSCAATLGQRTKRTLETVANVGTAVKGLSPVIAAVIDSLQRFEEHQLEAAAVSQRLLEQSGAIKISVSSLVRSIQFHDITRQRVQHVIEALTQLDAAHSQEDGELLTVQSLQLTAAGQTFVAAIKSLESDLDNIAVCVRQMADQGSGLLGTSQGERQSFFLEMEHCLAALLEAADGYNKGEIATTAAAGELADTLASMRDAAREIDTVNAHMLRVAQNANIGAEHIGAPGAPLGVLAVALQDMSTALMERSQAVSDALRSTSAALGCLSEKNNAENQQTHQGQAELVEEMRATLDQLQASSKTSVRCVRDVAALSSRLCEDISSAGKGLAIGSQFACVIDRSLHSLDEILVRTGTKPPDLAGSAAQQALNEFEKRYTMQAERDVHEAAVSAADVEPLAGSLLDDGIELF